MQSSSASFSSVDKALEEFQTPDFPANQQSRDFTEIRVEEADDEPSRSSSADLLDAFEFFNDAHTEAAEPESRAAAPIGYLTSPKINIIAASNENLANTDDLDYLDSLANTSSHAEVDNEVVSIDIMSELDPLATVNHSEADSESESESSDSESEDNNTKLVRDDSMDFDEIMSRPVADCSIPPSKITNEVWAGTNDSGIGVEFKATFSVSRLFISLCSKTDIPRECYVSTSLYLLYLPT